MIYSTSPDQSCRWTVSNRVALVSIWHLSLDNNYSQVQSILFGVLCSIDEVIQLNYWDGTGESTECWLNAVTFYHVILGQQREWNGGSGSIPIVDVTTDVEGRKFQLYVLCGGLMYCYVECNLLIALNSRVRFLGYNTGWVGNYCGTTITSSNPGRVDYWTRCLYLLPVHRDGNGSGLELYSLVYLFISTEITNDSSFH